VGCFALGQQASQNLSEGSPVLVLKNHGSIYGSTLGIKYGFKKK
jgi:hypothetical protein